MKNKNINSLKDQINKLENDINLKKDELSQSYIKIKKNVLTVPILIISSVALTGVYAWAKITRYQKQKNNSLKSSYNHPENKIEPKTINQNLITKSMDILALATATTNLIRMFRKK